MFFLWFMVSICGRTAGLRGLVCKDRAGGMPVLGRGGLSVLRRAQDDKLCLQRPVIVKYKYGHRVSRSCTEFRGGVMLRQAQDDNCVTPHSPRFKPWAMWEPTNGSLLRTTFVVCHRPPLSSLTTAKPSSTPIGLRLHNHSGILKNCCKLPNGKTMRW